MTYLLLLLFSVLLIFLLFYQKLKEKQQLAFIDHYQFPAKIFQQVHAAYPHLSADVLMYVNQALKNYFQICYLSNKKMIAMPSRVVDVAWHEFILFTRQYMHFCDNAFGYFLHHTPAEAMSTPTSAQMGIKRAWRIACQIEKINPVSPSHVPLLFAIDRILKIDDGFHYVINCQKNKSGCSDDGDEFCVTDIDCVSGCSGGSGHDDAGCFGDSSGCGGCGGD